MWVRVAGTHRAGGGGSSGGSGLSPLWPPLSRSPIGAIHTVHATRLRQLAEKPTKSPAAERCRMVGGVSSEAGAKGPAPAAAAFSHARGGARSKEPPLVSVRRLSHRNYTNLAQKLQ